MLVSILFYKEIKCKLTSKGWQLSSAATPFGVNLHIRLTVVEETETDTTRLEV